MRLVRFSIAGNTHFGVLEGARAEVVVPDMQRTGESFALADVKLLAPVEPRDIFAIGLNYRLHADESGAKYPVAPVIFLKATSSAIGPGDTILLPAMAPTEVDWEAELAIVIGCECHRVSEDDALDFVLGYTCGNDVSARDCQLKLDVQWARGKSFDTFCPLGPWIETDLDPDNADITLRLNGEVMQHSNTSDMIFNCRQLVSYCSQIATLRPGTVIMTGTPRGVGFAKKPPQYLKAGDTVEVEIAGLGTLTNPVAAE